MTHTLANLFCLSITWAAWLWLVNQDFVPALDLTIAITATLFILPLVFGGRWLLDRQPSVSRAEWVTLAVHYLLAIFFGSALIAATRFGLSSPGWPIPLHPGLGLGLMVLSGLLWLAVIINLIVKGSGLPFALLLTRVVATDWLYAWTRNPMVLSALAFLVGLGLWFRSGLFLIWVLIVVSPALLLFLKVYEERELEIRFGSSYLTYKARTPMFFPRRTR